MGTKGVSIMLRKRVLGVCAVLCVAFVGLAQAQVSHVGLYSPAALSKAGGNGAKAVLLHAVSGFCSKCNTQRAVLGEYYPLYPGVERHVVAMDVEMETWAGDKTLVGFGLVEPGQMALVRGTEVLAFVDSTSPEDIVALLDAVFQQPDWAPIDPMSVDPTSVDPNSVGAPAP
jgi:hypothetical protein